MDRISNFMSRRSTWPAFITRKDEPHLPISSQPKPVIRFRTLLGHCLYRRVVIWTFVVVVCLYFTLFNPRLNTTSREVLELVNLGKGQFKGKLEPEGNADLQVGDLQVAGLQVQAVDDKDQVSQSNPEIKPADENEKDPAEDREKSEDDPSSLNRPHWLKYKLLDGYYDGLRSLVPFTEYKPGYPETSYTSEPVPTVAQVHRTESFKPRVYRPQPDYNSEEYRTTYAPVRPCYLDDEKKIPVPDLYAYDGIPQGQPQPAMGSYDLLGIRQDVCFDRFSRYGPYGLGYGPEQGGTGVGIDTEREGSDAIWERTGKINFDSTDWASAQERCFLDNENRFFTGNATLDAHLAHMHPKRIDRTAVVIRLFTGFKWTSHTILNFRALVSELSLQSGGEYDVHFLLHVRDNATPIWADEVTVENILDENVPREFHGLCTLWSEAQMKLYYPGDFGDTFENPANSDIHGVYRSAHMPLQYFARMHPEYAHFWNWEMDMRWVGSYYELFDSLDKWAAKQSRLGIWERSAKYYIPAFHGDWNNFTRLVEEETQASGRQSVIGPVDFPGKTALQHGEEGLLPESCTPGYDMSKCGVGEDADLISLNPLFDADQSGWFFSGDVTGYDTQFDKPPRRSAIVTASRLSRRLLSVMHEETWRNHHSMFTEMFPPTIAFHHGLKAVYAPHPVYLERAWPVENIDKAFNGGRDHTTGGHGSPFDPTNEHNFKGTTWYYNSEFAGRLWRRWLGYAQSDGHANEGTLSGGRLEEEDRSSSGRLCLRNMLVHPIKWENPVEEDRY
ncbi:hypothetical protein DL770_008551 [Monosporascus sp. CRB-9-2]|nr:hypothetical protein DL770_008551 [Monosporascus sp. CRB-9-2]